MAKFDCLASDVASDETGGHVEITGSGDGRAPTSTLFLGIEGFTGEDISAICDAMFYDEARRRVGF